MIKNLQAKMGRSDFVQIRKNQRNAQRNALQVLFNTVYFRTEIPAGFFDQRQKFVNGVCGHQYLLHYPYLQKAEVI
jgi:hypothetical protein